MTAPSTPHRIAGLDGLRGIAIIAVIFSHYARIGAGRTALDSFIGPATIFGSYGVTLFFVLSGFLITGILLDQKGRPAYFRTFYARRLLRIFPLYYLVLLVLLIVVPQISSLRSILVSGAPVSAGGGAFFWLYISNFWMALHQSWPSPGLAVTWSLSIEEQFYLLWPAVVLICTRRGLVLVCIALVAVGFITRTILAVVGAPLQAAALPPAQFDALSMGALIALSARDPVWLGRLRSALRVAVPLLTMALVILVWLSQVYDHPLFPTLLGALFGLMVVVSLDGGGLVASVLRNPTLRAFGKYSYALYLFHEPVHQVVEAVYKPETFPTLAGSPLPGQALFVLLAGGLSFALAWLSWELFEKRILSLKRFFEYKTDRTADDHATGVARIGLAGVAGRP